MAATVDGTNLSVFDFVSKTANGLKGLVDSGISEVPEIYKMPPDELVDKVDKVDEYSSSEREHEFPSCVVPIDLSKLNGPEHDQVVDAIVKACESIGFFQVINHGVDLPLLESVKKAIHRFFEQPPEAKAAYHVGSTTNPLVKYSSSFLQDREKFLQWRDYCRMIYTNDEDVLTHWPKECREEAVEFLKLTNKLATTLFKILIQKLGVEVEESRLESLIGQKMVNMNYYPPCPNPELTMGVARHSDGGTLTVLLQDEVGGLFVRVDGDRAKKEEWVEIPPIPGALVINVGDSLELMSNGRYKSSEHATRTTDKQSRVSIPLWVTPLMSENVGPLPGLAELHGGAVYKQLSFQEFLNSYMGLPHEPGRKTLDYAKI